MHLVFGVIFASSCVWSIMYVSGWQSTSTIVACERRSIASMPHWPQSLSTRRRRTVAHQPRLMHVGGLPPTWGALAQAPQLEAPSAVAMKVLACVITSSPSPMPIMRKTRYSASVPLLHATQCFVPTKEAKLSSNAATLGPARHTDPHPKPSPQRPIAHWLWRPEAGARSGAEGAAPGGMEQTAGAGHGGHRGFGGKEAHRR